VKKELIGEAALIKKKKKKKNILKMCMDMQYTDFDSMRACWENDIECGLLMVCF